ncbi:hypothetical protein [Lichenibacterium dinghuense]|uniref:hypothetical protein n=1 Tax=Lichenibacterium dinghuense TaxID=2895977 RepID=UPI001F35C3BB|nr:hypothetical protein [Lichenibacterium sp. 6Y81]
MNRGMYDDHEVPGHGPTVILAHDDEGDAAAVPHEVAEALRHPPRMTKLEALDTFEADLRGSEDKEGCLRDWRRSYPHLADDLSRMYQDHLFGAFVASPSVPLPPGFGSPRLVHSGEPADPAPAMAPVYTALLLAICVQVLVTVLLVALRVGGALDWSWGWVTAPLWVPSTVATVLVVILGLALAALEERDAARRRRRA